MNGITICANGKLEIETIAYYHVELDTHEVILAEGLAVETLLRTSSATGFDNEHEYVAVYGVPTEPMKPMRRS